MAAAVLTNLYLDAAQRKFLDQRAKKNGTNLSAEARAAIELYRSGVSARDFELLDMATRRAKEDLDAINATLDAGARRAEIFFAQMASLKAGDDVPAGGYAVQPFEPLSAQEPQADAAGKRSAPSVSATGKARRRAKP
jgi:hypothetical protein